MRIIKNVFLSLLALILIACAGVFIFLQVFDPSQYLTPFTQKASLLLARQVSIGHLGVGLSSQGMSIDAGPVIVADDPGFTSQPFVMIDRVRIVPDLSDLILHHEFRVKNVIIQSPQIHLIRSQEGIFNLSNLGQGNNRVQLPNIENQGVMASEAKALIPDIRRGSQSRDDRGQPLTIKSIAIRNLIISFIDQSADNPKDIWLSNTNISLDDFSFENHSLRIHGLQLKADLSRLDIKDISTQLPDHSFVKNLAGVIDVHADDFGINPSGDVQANGELIISKGTIKNFNIIKVILSHTLGVFGNIDDILSGGLKDKLGANDTVIEKAEAKFTIHDKIIDLVDLLMATDLFELTAKGTIDQGFNIDLQTMLHLNTDVSSALVNELQGVKYLMDDSKRVAIGASLKGVYPQLKYKTDKGFRKRLKKVLIGSILSF
jgi:hypothetical protein